MEFIFKRPSHGQSAACMPILRALPDWFGIEEALVHYAAEIESLPTIIACDDGHNIGFVSLKKHNPLAAEIYVMGVVPGRHHQGVGRELLHHAEKWLKTQGVTYLQVKTLGPSHPDKNYAQTRAFYEAMGFVPLEEFKQIWNEENPCLVMIKQL